MKLARDPEAPSEALVLAEFLPFRHNRLADAVSSDLSEIYRNRFGLEIPEWRALVTVGQSSDCTAQYVAASTRMHKTRVSRAVAALEARGWLERFGNSSDGRELHLRLTRVGERTYKALVPLALDRERTLLSCLSAQQRQAFLDALSNFEASMELDT